MREVCVFAVLINPLAIHYKSNPENCEALTNAELAL